MRKKVSAVSFSDVPRGGRILIIGESADGSEISVRLMAKNAETQNFESFDCSLVEARAFLRDVRNLHVRRNKIDRVPRRIAPMTNNPEGPP